MSEFRRKIKAHENRASDMIGGRRQPASGAFSFAKGDGISENYVVECKRTDKKSISIKAEYLSKITKEATSQGRLPLLHIEIPAVDVMVEKDWVMMEASHFSELTERGRR